MSNQDAPKGKVGLLGRMFTGKTFKTKAEVEAEQKQKEAERIEELRRAAEAGDVPPFHKRPSLKKIRTAPDPNTPRKAVSFAGEVDVSPDPYDPEVDDVPLHDGDHYDDRDHYQDDGRGGYSDEEHSGDERHDDRHHEFEASPRAEHDSPHDDRESPRGRDDSYSHSDNSESEDIGPSDDDLHVQDSTAVRVIHPPAFNMPQSLSSVADGVMSAGSTQSYKRSATTATANVFGDQTSTKQWHDTNLSDQMREATRATTLPASALLRAGPPIQRTNTNTSNSASVSNYSNSNTGTDSSDSDSEADTIGLELRSGVKAQLNAIVREQVAAATFDAVAEAVQDDIVESTVKAESQSVARSALERSSPSSSPLAAPALSKAPTLGGMPAFNKMPTLGGSPKTAPAPAASLSMFAPLDASSSPPVNVPSAENVPNEKLVEDFAKFEKLRARRAPSTHTAYVSPYARDDSDPGVIAKHYESTVKAAPRRSNTQTANHSVAVITTNLFGRTSSHSNLQAPETPQVFSMAMNAIAERRQRMAESPNGSQELSLIDEDPDSEINSPRAPLQAARIPTVRGSLMGSPSASRNASLLNTARSVSLMRSTTRMFSSLAAPAKQSVALPPATAAALAATKTPMPSLASVVHAMMRAGKNKNQGKSVVLRSAVNKVRAQLQDQKKQKAAGPTTATDDEYVLAQKALEAAKSHIAEEEASKADEVIIRSLMDEMVDGVVTHIANDRWHEAVNKTWRAKKQRLELTKLVAEQKTELTKLMTKNRQIEKQRENIPKRPLPKLFTLIKTKGLAAAAAAVTQQAKKPFAFASVVKQAQKAAKNLKAAVAARKEAEAQAQVAVVEVAPVPQEPVDPDVQDVMSFLVDTVVDNEETMSHEEEIDRTVAFVLGGLVTKVEQSEAAAALLSKPDIQQAIVEKAAAVAAKPPSPTAAAEEEVERPVSRFQATPAILASLEAARQRALQLDYAFNAPERTLAGLHERFTGKEQALAALSAKRKEEEWGKKRQVKQIAANAMQLGQEVYRTLADSKEKQRMLERQALRAQSKREINAFNKVAEEEAAARIAAGEDAEIVHRQMRVAKAAALAHNFRNQQQIRNRTENGEAFAFVADSIAEQGAEDTKLSEEYATELARLQGELTVAEKEAVESDETMKKRLGRPLTEEERRSQDEKRVAHARRLIELRKALASLKSSQYRRLASRTLLPREQRARDYGNRKNAEKLLVAEENRRKAEDLIRKKALEREKAVVNPAVKEVLDDLIFHVEAEERAEAAIQDEVAFCVRSAEREAHNRELVRRDMATLQTHEQKTRRQTIAELEDQLASYEDRREMEKKASDEKFQTLRRAFPNAHPQWTFTKIHSLQLEYVARMERDEAARVEAQKKEMAIVRADLNAHLSELEQSRLNQDADAQVAHVVDVMCMFVEDDFNTWSVKKAAEEKARRIRDAEDARKKQQADLQATKLREVGVKATMESLLTAVEREVEKGIVAEVVQDLVATTEANLVFEQLLEEILPKEAKPIAKASREEFVFEELVDAETTVIAREEFLQAEVKETMSDIMHVILIRHYGKFLKQQFTILREAAKRSRRLGTWAIERMRPYIERAKKRVNIRKTIEEKKRKEAELQLRLLEEAQKRKAAQEAELARLNAMQVEERNREIQRIREHEAAIVLQRYYRLHRNKRIHSSIEHRSEMAIRIQKVFRGYTARKQLGVQYTAAQKIQARFRGFILRKKLRLENAASVEVQRFYRGYKTRKAVEQYQYYLKDLQQQLASNEAKLRRVYEDMKKLKDAKASTARDSRLAALTADFEKLKEARKELRAEMKKSPNIRDFWHGANAKHGTQFKAATTIQRVFRGYKHRVDFRKTKAAVIQIQRVFRGHKGRKAYLATRELSRREQEDLARMERVTKERAIVEAAKKEQWALEAHIREVEYKEKERLEEVEQMTSRRQSQIQLQREENEKRERDRIAQEQLLLTSRKRLESTIETLKAKKEAALALLTKKEKEDEKKYGTNRTVVTTSARRRRDELDAQRSKIEEEANKLEVTACLEFVISAVERTENARVEQLVAEQLQREKEMRARMRAEKKALLEKLQKQISTEEQRRIDLEAQAKKQLEETLKKRGLRSQVGGDSSMDGPDMGPEVHSLTPEQLEKERKEAERKRIEAQKEQKRKEVEAQLAKLEAMKKAEQQRAAKDKKWESILRIATTGDASIGDLCSITDAEVEHPSIDDVSNAPTLSAADKASGKKQKVFHTGKTPRGARRESSRMGLVGGAGTNSPSSTPPLSPQNSDSNLRRKQPTDADGCSVM